MVTMNGGSSASNCDPSDTANVTLLTTASGLQTTLDHSLDDDDDEGMSDGSEGYDDGVDLLTSAMEDEVTAQLAAAGMYLLVSILAVKKGPCANCYLLLFA
jgi:hypothetical protein